MALNIAVPFDVAEEVTQEGLAEWALGTRSDPGVVAITVSLLGVAANLATVVASADAVRGIAHRLAMWALRRSPKPESGTSVELEVTLQGGPSIRVTALSPADKMAIKVLGDELTRIVVDFAVQKGGQGHG